MVRSAAILALSALLFEPPVYAQQGDLRVSAEQRMLIDATNELSALNRRIQPPTAAEARRAARMVCDTLTAVLNSREFRTQIEQGFKETPPNDPYTAALRNSVVAFVTEFIEPERALLARANVSDAAQAEILSAASTLQAFAGKQGGPVVANFFGNLLKFKNLVCTAEVNAQRQSDRVADEAERRRLRAIALGLAMATLVSLDGAAGVPTAGWSGVSIALGASVFAAILTDLAK